MFLFALTQIQSQILKIKIQTEDINTFVHRRVHFLRYIFKKIRFAREKNHTRWNLRHCKVVVTFNMTKY